MNSNGMRNTTDTPDSIASVQFCECNGCYRCSGYECNRVADVTSYGPDDVNGDYPIYLCVPCEDQAREMR